MTWRDLLQTKDETLVSPWVGGRSLRSGSRQWTIDGRLPDEHGWVVFSLNGRRARVLRQADDSDTDLLMGKVMGYLVGDRLVPRDVRVEPKIADIVANAERVHLIEPFLDRFVYVSAGRMCEDGPLFFMQQEMPLGPEMDVLTAYLDGKDSVADIKDVSPALDAAFRMEIFQRKEAEKRRRELAEKRQREEEERQKEARRREIVEKLGDGAGRREMALLDFEEAAKAALAVGGAVLLDQRAGHRKNEMIVKYRLKRRRFECTCDKKTLRIIDSGVCLTDHDTGEKGDDLLTLESLPSVILEAERTGQLVVYRHV